MSRASYVSSSGLCRHRCHCRCRQAESKPSSSRVRADRRPNELAPAVVRAECEPRSRSRPQRRRLEHAAIRVRVVLLRALAPSKLRLTRVRAEIELRSSRVGSVRHLQGIAGLGYSIEVLTTEREPEGGSGSQPPAPALESPVSALFGEAPSDASVYVGTCVKRFLFENVRTHVRT